MTIGKRLWRWTVWPIRNRALHRARRIRHALGGRLGAGMRRSLSVIVLSYARPANIDKILSTLVLCEFVGEIIVSNNNPAVSLERYVSVTDPRIRIVHQPVPTPASVRFDLSRHAQHDDIIAIDDDIFPSPRQVRILYERLLANPAVPHGFGGETWGRPPSLATRRLVSRVPGSAPVDALVWIFAYTKAHVRRYFELLRALNIENGDLRSSEDVVLSFSGEGDALVHGVGRLHFCPSDDDDAIATFKRPGFVEHRLDLVERCLRLRAARDA